MLSNKAQTVTKHKARRSSVDKVYFRFNLLQLYRSGPLAQINGRCTELVAGRGWRHTCLMTPSRLYSGLGASKGVV